MCVFKYNIYTYIRMDCYEKNIYEVGMKAFHV